MASSGALQWACFALAFIAGIVSTWFRPIYGVAGLIVLDPFDLSYGVSGTTVTLPKAYLVGLLVGLALRRCSVRPLWDPTVRPILIGAAAIVVATSLAATQATTQAPALREIAKAVEYFLVFAGSAVAFASDPDERIFGAALAFGAALVSLAAMSQEFTGTASALYMGTRVFPRIAGPLEGPNQLAGYFDVVLPVLLALVLGAERRGWLLAALVVCALADVLTLSRAGVLAALVGIAAVLLRGARGTRARQYAAGVGGVAFLVFVGLGALGLLKRFASFDEPERPTGLGTRRELWQAAIDLWRAHPWLGVGGGNYELELPQAGVTDAQTHANSLYLQSLAEGGIVLFLATVGTLVATLRSLWRAAGRSPLTLGAFGATLALALHQLFDLLVFFPKVGVIWWLVLGAGAAAGMRKAAPRGTSKEVV